MSCLGLGQGWYGTGDDGAWSVAVGEVSVASGGAEGGEELVHDPSGGGVRAFVVDGVREGEVALSEREADLDRVAVEGPDLLASCDWLARFNGRRDPFGHVDVVAGVGPFGELVRDPAVAVAPAGVRGADEDDAPGPRASMEPVPL